MLLDNETVGGSGVGVGVGCGLSGLAFWGVLFLGASSLASHGGGRGTVLGSGGNTRFRPRGMNTRPSENFRFFEFNIVHQDVSCLQNKDETASHGRASRDMGAQRGTVYTSHLRSYSFF